jgi:hypothetical protein
MGAYDRNAINAPSRKNLLLVEFVRQVGEFIIELF